MDVIRFLEVPRLDAERENFTTVLAAPSLRIVRVVSSGHASPAGYWYDQDEHEWVMLLAGEAELTVEGRGSVRLGPGDAILLPRRTRHRVEWTSREVETIWLAVFFGGELASELPAAASERILEHMNADHADSLLDYARVLRGLAGATAAKMTSVDAAGFDVEAETETGARQLRFPFDPPVADARDAREALVAMAHEARRRG
jgi:cupin 2 domain-containing protein